MFFKSYHHIELHDYIFFTIFKSKNIELDLENRSTNRRRRHRHRKPKASKTCLHLVSIITLIFAHV